MRSNWFMSVASLVLLISLLILPQNIKGLPTVPSQDIGEYTLRTGPHLDSVTFNIMEDTAQLIAGLQSGTIDMYTEFLSETQVNSLISSDSFIEAYNVTRNGYGQITINCRDAPLNESTLRRAFAYAFDKTAVTADILDGFSQEHDSLVPFPNGWCIEDQFTSHYYTDQSTIGNQMLNDSGLFPFDGAGEYRTYKGDSFNITIEYAVSFPEIAGGTAQIGVDALRRLGINAETRATDFNEFLSRLDSHGEYDMVFYARTFYDNDVSWLAYEYWSDYANTPYQNPTNFRNTTYDSWRDQLLYGIAYEEVFEAAAEMQKILQYNVPRLVCYENHAYQAYRTDLFEGHINDLVEGISGSWSLRQMRAIGASHGGNVSVGVVQAPTNFNIFNSESSSSQMILDLLYPSLYDYDPTLRPIGDLAKNLIVQRNSDNFEVPVGHSRYTINILENATWSDGTPLTAHDVNFTLQFVSRHSNALPGSFWYGGGMPPSSLIATDVLSPYQIVLEFDTESYWDFSYFAHGYIIPEHLFSNGTITWDEWDPIFNPAHPLITCGPFLLDDFEVDEYYSLMYNPEFYYALNRTAVITTGPTSSTTPSDTEPQNLLPLFLFVISTVSAIVIITAVILSYRHKNAEHEEDPPSQETPSVETGPEDSIIE